MLMNIYVLRILTGKEEQFLKLAEPLGLNLFFPKRELTLTRGGKRQSVEQPLFPGYVFLECDEVYASMCNDIREIPYFCRFLKDNSLIIPLPENERRIIFELTKYGRTIRKSFVIFNENDKIEVTDGPLKGLEGLIIKVDRRKKRAKVMLTMYENAFPIDFGYELMDKKQ